MVRPTKRVTLATNGGGRMVFLKILGLVVGLLAVAMGVLWMGQGVGLILWPAESFMLNQRTWAFNGALLAGAGLLIGWLSWRSSSRR